MKMQNELQAQTKILRKRIVILSIAAVLLIMCLYYSFLRTPSSLMALS